VSVVEQPKYGQYRGTPTPSPVSSTASPPLRACPPRSWPASCVRSPP